MLRVGKKQTGFTIVELLIVIVVIGILAALVLNAFSSAQATARDGAIKNAAEVLDKAIRTYAVNTGNTVLTGFGWGSTGTDANGDCVGGSGAGFVEYGEYNCNLEDELVNQHLLQAGFGRSLPPNTVYSPSTWTTFMFYVCNNGQPNQFFLAYSLEKPSSADNTNYASLASRCGIGAQLHDTYGMRGARIVIIPT